MQHQRACFAYDSDAITGYYSYENNNSSNPECPREVIIPEKIGNTTIKVIEEWAFSNKSLTKVKLPSTITEIKLAAFYTNQLTEIIIPEGVTLLGYVAFYENNLINITISSTVPEVYDNTFGWNPNITTIYMKGSNTIVSNTFLGNDTFKNAYDSNGAGTYIGTVGGTWEKNNT